MSDPHPGAPHPGAPQAHPSPQGPSPANARPPLEPVGTLLSRTLELYKAHFTAFVATAAIVLVPVFVVRDGLVALFIGTSQISAARMGDRAERIQDFSERMQALDASDLQRAEDIQRMQEELVRESLGVAAEGAGALGGIVASLLVLLLSIPLTVLGTYLAQGALTVLVNDRAAQGNLGPGGAWAQLMPRLPAVLLTGLLVAVGVSIGTVMCVLPAIIFGFVCAFVMPIVVLEGQSGVTAIERSIRMVQLDFVRVLIAVLIMFAIHLGFGLFASVLPLGAFGSALVADLFSIAVLPLPITALVLMHRELLAKGLVPPLPAR